jgi:hypothetical protein
MLEHHPHGPRPHLRCKSRRSRCHSSILSRVGASGKPGAVQIVLAVEVGLSNVSIGGERCRPLRRVFRALELGPLHLDDAGGSLVEGDGLCRRSRQLGPERPLTAEPVIECGLLAGLFVRLMSAAGRDGDARSGAKSMKASSEKVSGLPDRDHVDHLPIRFMPSSQLFGPASTQAAGSGGGDGTAIDLAARQHRPDATRHLVHQREGRDHRGLALQHARKPRILRGAMAQSPADHGDRPDDQQARECRVEASLRSSRAAACRRSRSAAARGRARRRNRDLV